MIVCMHYNRSILQLVPGDISAKKKGTPNATIPVVCMVGQNCPSDLQTIIDNELTATTGRDENTSNYRRQPAEFNCSGRKRLLADEQITR